MSQKQLFLDFFNFCLDVPPSHSHEPIFNKLNDAEIAKYNEGEALNSGAILETTLQKGEGLETPCNGDMVYFHFAIHRVDDGERMIFSTRPDNGCTEGAPYAAILYKSPRLPRAWEMTLSEMTKGERRILKMQPEFGFKHKECEFHLPAEMEEDEGHELMVDIQLVNWYSAQNVMSTMGASWNWILKRVVIEGVGYENPRPPYKVEIFITLRKLAVDGVQQNGEVLFEKTDVPIEVVMGDDAVPDVIQSCIGSMVQNEHAVCIFSTREENRADRTHTIFPPFPEEALQIEADINLLRVIQVRDIYGDGRIMKYRTVDGKGTFPSDCPLQDCRVDVHYKVRKWIASPPSDNTTPTDCSAWTYDSRMEDSDQPITVDLGCGALPVGLEACIHLMLPGEISRAECRADVAYNNPNTRCPVPDGLVAENDVEFEVELVSFRKGMQWAGISAQESLEEAQKMKDKANTLYLEGATQLAANKYKKIVQQLSALHDFETEEQVEKADRLTFNCFSNLASCSIQDAEYVAAIEWCNKALKLYDENGKVLLRRAKAYSLHGDFDEAEADLRVVEKLGEPFEKDVQALLLKNQQRRKAASLKQKAQFRNFFDR